MKKVTCRTGYNARDDERVSLLCPDDGLTQQHFKLECDVNEIVRRYVQTGDVALLEGSSPVYADVSELPDDLASAYDAIGQAEDAFMRLPSQVRKSLDNDPSRLVQWLANPDNKDVAVKFGLMNLPVDKNETNVSIENVEKKPSEPLKE